MRLQKGLGWFRRRSNLERTAAILFVVATVFAATREVIKEAGGTADSVGGIFSGGGESKRHAEATPDDPQAFAAYFIRLFFSEPSRYWALLNPAEQKAVPEKAYLDCLDPPTGLVSVKPLDIYRGPIAHGPWALDRTQVTKVTLKTKLRGPDDKIHIDKPSVLLVREEGHWTGLLKDYEYTALKNHRCPPYRTVAFRQPANPNGPGRGPATSPTRPIGNATTKAGGDKAVATGSAGTDEPGRNTAASPPVQPGTDVPGTSRPASRPGARKTIPVGPGD